MLREYIAIIWPTGYKYRREMWDFYKSNSSVARITPLHTIEFADADAFMRFIYSVYAQDELSRDILEYKTRLMIQMSRLQCAAFSFTCRSTVDAAETDPKVLGIKTAIRQLISAKMDDYYYDTLLHATDTRDEYSTIAQILRAKCIEL